MTIEKPRASWLRCETLRREVASVSEELPFVEAEGADKGTTAPIEQATSDGKPEGSEERHPTPDKSVSDESPAAMRLESTPAQGTATRTRRANGSQSRGSTQGKGKESDSGADLERRVGRTEFNDGALVRLRVPIRVDADSGRDVLTDIDVLAIDVDGRLRISRSILECKSGKGQAGEPDRLLWLAGLQRFLSFERAVLVRQTLSRRGRGLARALGLRTLDFDTLAAREKAHAWLPERFAHIDGPECTAAEQRSDTQLKGLGHIPPELVAFLRFDALRAEPHRALRAIASLGRAADSGGVLPNPTRGVLAGHALMALIAAAVSDAGRLDEISASELLDRTRRALATGNPDDDQVFNLLGRADELVRYSLERVHAAYQENGAKRLDVDIPSLRGAVTTPPSWVPRYVDLVEKLRANPAVSRQMLQTAELAVFEALVGGRAHESPAFDHLFTREHRYMLNLARRCLADIAGLSVAEALVGALELDFGRGATPRADRDANPAGRQAPS
jgi:hypothetical protein